jgi:hypothetical protein
MTDMAKDGLKRGREKLIWMLLAVPLMAGLMGVESSKAAPQGAKSAVKPKAGAKASAPAKTAKKAPKKKAAGSTTASVKPNEPEIAGRRDPFKLPGPPVQGPGGSDQPLGPLPPGTRGLVIGQIRVEGIVRLDTTSTMIAVVDNASNRAYFLRENDAVYNGVVTKITPDAVMFRENALDRSGKVVIREVVKRLGQGPGA